MYHKISSYSKDNVVSPYYLDPSLTGLEIYLIVEALRSDFLGICSQDTFKELCEAVDYLYGNFISKDANFSYIQFYSNNDPLSERSFELYPQMVEFLELFFGANPQFTSAEYFSTSSTKYKTLSSNISLSEEIPFPVFKSSGSSTSKSHNISSVFKAISSFKKLEKKSNNLYDHKISSKQLGAASSGLSSDPDILLKPSSPFPITTSMGFQVGWDGLSFQMVLFFIFALVLFLNFYLIVRCSH
jgi:hypothetical protein